MRGAAGAAQVSDDVAARSSRSRARAQVRADHGARRARARRVSERPDMVLVPGGGWIDARRDGRVGARRSAARSRAAIAERHAARQRRSRRSAPARCCSPPPASPTAAPRRPITSRSTTCAACGAEVVEARVVDDGDMITAGGVASGIDLALQIVERIGGAAIADAVAREIGYERPAGGVHVQNAASSLAKPRPGRRRPSGTPCPTSTRSCASGSRSSASSAIATGCARSSSAHSSRTGLSDQPVAVEQVPKYRPSGQRADRARPACAARFALPPTSANAWRTRSRAAGF